MRGPKYRRGGADCYIESRIATYFGDYPVIQAELSIDMIALPMVIPFAEVSYLWMDEEIRRIYQMST